MIELLDPRWRGKDEQTARQAVERMTNQRKLERAAKKSRWQDLRLMAVNKLTDQAALERIACGGWFGRHGGAGDSRVIEAAIDRLTEQPRLVSIVVTSNLLPFKYRQRALKRLTDQAALTKIASDPHSRDLGVEAAARLADSTLLVQMACGQVAGIDPCVVVGRLADPALLARVARGEPEPSHRVRVKVLDRLLEIKGSADPTAMTNALVDVVSHGKLYPADQIRATEAIPNRIAAQNIWLALAQSNEKPGNRIEAALRLDDKAAAQEVYADIALHTDDFACCMEAVALLDDPKTAREACRSVAKLHPGATAMVQAVEGAEDAALIGDVTQAWKAFHHKTLLVETPRYRSLPEEEQKGAWRIGPSLELEVRKKSHKGVTEQDLRWADDVVINLQTTGPIVVEGWAELVAAKAVLHVALPGYAAGYSIEVEVGRESLKRVALSGFWPQPGRIVEHKVRLEHAEKTINHCRECQGRGLIDEFGNGSDVTCDACGGTGDGSYTVQRHVRDHVTLREWENFAALREGSPLRTSTVSFPPAY